MSNETNSAGCSPSDCASCSSNCGSNPNNSTPGFITLTMDDGTEVNCAIITVYPVEDKEYMVLLPLDDDGKPTSDEVFLYSFEKAEDGSPILANIEDDDEYATAAEAFNVILENARQQEAAGAPIEFDVEEVEGSVPEQ